MIDKDTVSKGDFAASVARTGTRTGTRNGKVGGGQ
jgi:hypothetical protein